MIYISLLMPMLWGLSPISFESCAYTISVKSTHMPEFSCARTMDCWIMCMPLYKITHITLDGILEFLVNQACCISDMPNYGSKCCMQQILETVYPHTTLLGSSYPPNTSLEHQQPRAFRPNDQVACIAPSHHLPLNIPIWYLEKDSTNVTEGSQVATRARLVPLIGLCTHRGRCRGLCGRKVWG